MIEISGLELLTPDFSLGPLNLRVEEGAYCVLLGPSGAGKSSLLEWIAGFRHCARGELRIGGRNMARVSPGDRNASLVFQEAALFPHLSVRENIAFPLRVRGASQSERQERTIELARLFRIGHRLDAYPQTLSGGESRRVALARAVAHPRSVLLLDEPLAAMDGGLHQDMVSLFRTIRSELGLTVLHVTHSVAEARRLATHVGVLIDGSLRQFGETAEVFERPVDVEVARTLGVSNILVGEVNSSAGFFSSQGGVRLPLERTKGNGKRARLFNLRLAEAPGAVACGATVVDVDYSAIGGKTVRVVLEESLVELTLPVVDEGIGLGSRVWVDWNAVEAELF